MRGSGAIHGATDSGIYVDVVGGDGITTFELAVESQVKGARSAGRFKLGLGLTDDAIGEATRADWRFSREAPGDAKLVADDSAMFGFVRDLAIRGERLTRTKLREHDERPIAERRATAALDRMIEGGRLELVNGIVTIPEPSSIGGCS